MPANLPGTCGKMLALCLKEPMKESWALWCSAFWRELQVACDRFHRDLVRCVHGTSAANCISSACIPQPHRVVGHPHLRDFLGCRCSHICFCVSILYEIRPRLTLRVVLAAT